MINLGIGKAVVLTRSQAIESAPRGWRAIVGTLYDALVVSGWDGELYQVKQKFGWLRFYTGPLTPAQMVHLDVAESMSGITCEVCGAPGGQITRDCWVNALCATHAADPRPVWLQTKELDKP